MSDTDLFQLVQIGYWLALSTWFGGTLFIAIAAQVIQNTVQTAEPILPDVLAVNLDGQHATLLAGTIVARLQERMTLIELVCAAVLIAASAGQFGLIDLSDNNRVAMIMRVLMLLAAAGVVLYHWRAVWPKIQSYRQQYIDHADEPDVANVARDQFDREQKFSLSLLMTTLFLLLGVILFSGNISPKKAALAPGSSSAAAK